MEKYWIGNIHKNLESHIHVWIVVGVILVATTRTTDPRKRGCCVSILTAASLRVEWPANLASNRSTNGSAFSFFFAALSLEWSGILLISFIHLLAFNIDGKVSVEWRETKERERNNHVVILNRYVDFILARLGFELSFVSFSVGIEERRSWLGTKRFCLWRANYLNQ